MSSQQFEIKIGVNSSGVQAGINSAIRQVGGLITSFQNLKGVASGGALLLALVLKMREGFNAVRELVKEIRRGMAETGLNSDQYQNLVNTLNSLDIAADKAHNALEQIAQTQAKIREGKDKEAVAALAKQYAVLGVSLDDLRKKSHSTIFFQIASVLKSEKVDAETLNALQATMGGKAADLLPAFKKGFDSPFSLITGLGPKEIEKVEEFNRAWNKVQSSVKGVTVELGALAAEMAVKGLNLLGITGDDESNSLTARLEAKLAKNLKTKAERQAREIVVEKNYNTLATPDADKLLSIGGYRGGGDIARIPGQQLQVQQRMEQHLQRVAHYTSHLADGVRDPETRVLLNRVENFFRTAGLEWE